MQDSAEKGANPNAGAAAADAETPAKACENGKNHKKKKSYDVVANQNQLIEKVNNQLMRGIQEQMGKAVADCEESRKHAKETFPTEIAFFKDYESTVIARQEIASAVLSEKDNGDAELVALIESQRTQKVLSIDDVASLTTLKTAAGSLTETTKKALSEDDIKLAIKSLKDSLAAFKRVVAAVSRAANDLKRAVDQKQKKAEADVSKKRKQDEAKQKKDLREMTKKMKQGNQGETLPALWVSGPMTEKLCKALLVYDSLESLKADFKVGASINHVCKVVKTAKKIAACGFEAIFVCQAGANLHSGVPYIVQSKAVESLKEELAKDSVKGFLQIFETQFPLSKQAREKGRVQSVMKVESTARLKELMMELVSGKVKVFNGDGPNSDMDCLHSYGFTSNMRYGGTEYLGLGTVRYAVKGSREVVIVNASEMWPLLLEHHAEEASKLAADKLVANFLGEKLLHVKCDDAWVQALLKTGKSIMWRALVPEGSMLFVPAGVILLERSTNNCLGMGLRMAVDDSSNQSLANLDTLLAAHMTYADAKDKLVARWQDCVNRARKSSAPAPAASSGQPAA